MTKILSKFKNNQNILETLKLTNYTRNLKENDQNTSRNLKIIKISPKPKR